MQVDGCIELPAALLPQAVRVGWQDVEQPARGETRAQAAVYPFQRHAEAAASIRLRTGGSGEDVPAAVRVAIAQALNGHVVCPGAQLDVAPFGLITVEETLPGKACVTVVARTRVSLLAPDGAGAGSGIAASGAGRPSAASTPVGSTAADAARDVPRKSASVAPSASPSAPAQAPAGWMPPARRSKTAISFTSSPSPSPSSAQNTNTSSATPLPRASATCFTSPCSTPSSPQPLPTPPTGQSTCQREEPEEPEQPEPAPTHSPAPLPSSASSPSPSPSPSSASTRMSVEKEGEDTKEREGTATPQPTARAHASSASHSPATWRAQPPPLTARALAQRLYATPHTCPLAFPCVCLFLCAWACVRVRACLWDMERHARDIDACLCDIEFPPHCVCQSASLDHLVVQGRAQHSAWSWSTPGKHGLTRRGIGP